MKKTLTFIFLLAAISSFAQVIDTDRSQYDLGDAVTVSYQALQDSSRIYLYQDEAPLPLADYLLVENTAEGTWTPTTSIESGTYTVQNVDKTGKAGIKHSFLVNDGALREQGKRIFVVSDIHVMSPELLVSEGSAYTNAMNSSRKMHAESAEVFDTLVSVILRERPDLVLIPGDLTKSGERLSHEYVVSGLNQLLSAGIPALVIPGNHDIDNSSAVAYDGGSTVKVASVNTDEFAQLYADFGYNTTCDPNSLSYMAEPLDGLCVLATDAYGEMDDNTLQWLLTQADQATASGKMVIAMMHQSLLQHFTGLSQVLPTAAIANGEDLAEQFMQHGVHLFLTGHIHVSNITKYYNRMLTDSIYDISSGSPIEYPCPYRWLTIDNGTGEVSVQTRYVRSITSVENLTVRSKEQLLSQSESILENMVTAFWPQYEQMLSTLESNQVFAPLLAYVPGDKETLSLIVKIFYKESFEWGLMTFSEGNENRKLRQMLYDKIIAATDDMLSLMLPEALSQIAAIKALLIYSIQNTIEEATYSLLTDTSYYMTQYENQTNDLFLDFQLPLAQARSSLNRVEQTAENEALYDLLGRLVSGTQMQHGVYIRNGQKILK